MWFFLVFIVAAWELLFEGWFWVLECVLRVCGFLRFLEGFGFHSVCWFLVGWFWF